MSQDKDISEKGAKVSVEEMVPDFTSGPVSCTPQLILMDLADHLTKQSQGLFTPRITTTTFTRAGDSKVMNRLIIRCPFIDDYDSILIALTSDSLIPGYPAFLELGETRPDDPGCKDEAELRSALKEFLHSTETTQLLRALFSTSKRSDQANQGIKDYHNALAAEEEENNRSNRW